MFSVLFALFVHCVRGDFSLFVVKCCRFVCVLLFSHGILLRCVLFLLTLAVLVLYVTLSVIDKFCGFNNDKD